MKYEPFHTMQTLLQEPEAPQSALEAAIHDVEISLRTDSSRRGNEVLKAIESLASIPGGDFRACKYTFALARKLATKLGTDGGRWITPYLMAEWVVREFKDMDHVLAAKILASKWKTLCSAEKTDGNGWTGHQVLRCIRQVNGKFEQYVSPDLDVSSGSAGFVHRCEKRRLAGIVATMVAGHLLPPELVEMIREEVYSEGEVEGYVHGLRR
ncbi:hypothetical protein LTR85_000228 [Meristemomyces frigidus]|nr:hypothetical protein LTR85_000228 [Meristemomyces frigidus]